MNSIKNLKSLFLVLVGAFGISTMFSSCAKEKTCICSVTYDNVTLDALEVTTKGKCEDVQISEVEGQEDEIGEVTCRDK